MINIKTGNIPDIRIKRSINEIKKSGEKSENHNVSFGSSAAAEAMSAAGKSLLNKTFKPAQTYEELERQINNADWISDENKSGASSELHNLKERDIPVVSRVINATSRLSPELISKFKVRSFLFGCTYCGVSELENFSPEKLNALLPEIQKGITNLDYYFSYPPGAPDGTNELYKTLPDKFKDSIHADIHIIASDKYKNARYIQIAKTVGKIDEEIIEKIGIENLFVNSKLSPELLDETLSAVNSVPAETKSEFSSAYLHKITHNSYSYALKHNNDIPVCGSDDFVPFTTKEELKTELASMKTKNGEWMFSDKEIEHITGNQNDIGELSLILNEVAKKQIELPQRVLFGILSREGVSFDIVKSQINFYEKTQTDKVYEDLKEITAENPDYIFSMEPDDIKSADRNIGFAKVMKNIYPYHFEEYPEYVYAALIGAKMTPETFISIMNDEIYPEKPNMREATSLIIHDKAENICEKNIKFIKDAKSIPELSFIFNGGRSFFDRGIDNDNITTVLTAKLPDGDDIKSKKDLIGLITDINNEGDTSAKRVFGNCEKINYLAVLAAAKNEDAKTGRDIVEFIKSKTEEECPPAKYLCSHSFSKTYELLQKFGNNPLLKDSYAIIPDFGYDLLNEYNDITLFASEFDEFKTCKLRHNDILKNYDNGEYNIKFDIEAKKSNIEQMAATLKKIPDNTREKIASSALEKVLSNTFSVPYSFKDENISYFTGLIQDERFKNHIEDIYPEKLCSLFSHESDIEELEKNKEEMLEFFDRSEQDKNIFINKSSFLDYEGNYAKLQQEIKKLHGIYPGKRICVSPDREKVSLSIDGIMYYRFDKELNLKEKTLRYGFNRRNGTPAGAQSIYNPERGIKTYNIFSKDAATNIYKSEKIVSVYSDPKGRHIKTKSYEQSNTEGILNSKEILPDGKVKCLSEAKKKNGTIDVNQHLTSPAGIKTDVIYKKDGKGGEFYDYKITGKDGKLLSQVTRKTRFISENEKETSVNGVKYGIIYNDDLIEVENKISGQKRILDLNCLNPKNNPTIRDMLKQIPGDELMILPDYVSEIRLTKKIDSKLNHDKKILYTGPHSFIFEHELGHAKDEINTKDITKEDFLEGNFYSKISGDKQLKSIFEREKNMMQKEAPSVVGEETNYFIDDGKNHYAGKKGGLIETVAEINAINSFAAAHPVLQTRTHFLKEYFPETIAYINNNYLNV